MQPSEPQERPDPAADPGAGGGQLLLPYPLKRIGQAKQVIIVTTRSWTGTQAQLEAYEELEGGWERVIGPAQARVGRTGMIAAEKRVAGSGTTPAGTFPLTMTFGLEPDPGTKMPYVYVTDADRWWVTDPSSPHYNQLRSGEEGGFHPSEHGKRGSLRLHAHPKELAFAVVIDFNRPYPVRTRGAGIFIQVSTGLSTDGSVAVERDCLLQLLEWLDPHKHPVITLAPERVIAQY
ncbi:MAG TPA: hypothetical protein VFP72_15970 [Kineosporiaceae bacterium]|nr:hypothetical protein [Kineosporiaceae bacterium]